MVRFGIVGAGSIARKFAKDISVVPNAELVAVASRTLEKAQIFQNEFNIKHAFGSYLELAESNVVDAIYIATPHSFHKDQAILFLNHDKHVLCEKPLAVNQYEVNEMLETAKRNNKLLMEAMWAIFLPANQYVLNIVKEKKLGEIKRMDFSFGFDLVDLEKVKDKRLLNINLAGGSLLDVGVYNIAISQFLKDDPIKSIQTDASFYKTGVDLRTDSTIEYNDGVILTAHSAVNKELQNDAVLTFEKGDIIIPDFWCASSVIVNGEKVMFPMKSEGFEYEIESFVNTIERNEIENPVMTHSRSKKIASILDLIRKDINLVYPNDK